MKIAETPVSPMPDVSQHANKTPQDKRLHPRVHTDLNADLRCRSGFETPVAVRNLSLGGLMVDGDILLKEQLTSGNNNPYDQTPAEVSLRLLIPSQPTALQLRCRLVFIRRLSQQQFNFGFRFFALTTFEAEQLQEYVTGLLDQQD